MKTRQLFIGDEAIDVWGDEDIPIDYAVADIREIGEGLSDATRTFAVVGSRENLRKLGMPDLLSGADITAINQQTRIAARYEVGGLPVIAGYYKIIDVSIDKGHTIVKGMIVSGNGTWVQQLEAVALQDLDFSADQHLYTGANIVLSWSGYDLNSYIYPFVDYGGNYPLTLPVKYFRPAVKIRAIVDRIFQGIGWTYTSAFFSGTFFSSIYELCGHEENLPATFASDRSFLVKRDTARNFTVSTSNVPTTFVLAFDGVTSAPTAGTYNATTGVYSVPDAMVARCSVNLIIDVIGFNYYQKLNLTVFVYGGLPGAVQDLARKTVTIEWDHLVTTKPPYAISFETESLEFQSGGVAYVSIYAWHAGGVTVANNYFTVNIGSSWHFVAEQKITKGSTIDPVYFLPKVSQLEFLQAIKHKFNLVFFPDLNQRKLYVEPFDQFFLPVAQAVDWTLKVDRSQEVSIEYNEIANKELLIGYAEDGNDWNLQLYDEKNDVPYGAALHTYGNAYAKGREEKRCGVFAPTYMARIGRSLGRINRTNVYPVIWKEPDEDASVPELSFEHEPRLLYFSGLESNGTTWSLDGVSVLTLPRFWFAGLDTANDASLSFDTGVNSNGLKDKYYRRALHQQEIGREVRMKVHLTQADVQQFDPRKPVKIDQAYYLVVELSEWSADRPTEVVMLERRTTGAVVGKTITGNTVPPVVCKSKPAGVGVGSAVYMLDTRFRPPQILPVLIETESGTLEQVYTGG